jgi:glycosyltransferase involved in cell wall biosynthesis
MPVTQYHPGGESELAAPSRAGEASRLDDRPIEVSIVMPCLNEVRTLGRCIAKAERSLREHAVAGEIIVADNGSTDGSQALATRLGARVVAVEARGYGNALKGGIAAARGRYIIVGDSDDSYDLGNLMPFIAKLREGYDLVMGNRFRGGIEAGAMPPLHRYFGNPLLTAIGRLFFKSPCGDFYCGQRGFTKAAAEAMELQSTGMEFALEMLVKATMMGMRVAETPVTLSPDGRDRPPHLRSWRDGWRSLRFFLVYSPRWLFFYPALLLMILGTAVGLWLLPGPRRVGGVTLDVHTLIYCMAAIVLGFQLMTFSVFGKFLAIATGLHPRKPKLEARFEAAWMEIGLLIGALLIALGLGASVLATYLWAESRFGDLDPFRMMRIVIPAVLALSLGSLVIFSSFYLNLLQVQFRKARSRHPVAGPRVSGGAPQRPDPAGPGPDAGAA